MGIKLILIMINFLIKKFVKNWENVTDGKVRESYGSLAGILGIIFNVLLFAFKALIGFFTASIAIIADAFNNLTDAGSSIISIIGFRLANKPVDKDHPFGHGRIEYLAGLLVSIIIILVGVELAISSVEKIFEATVSEFSVIAVIILSVSVLIKLYMYFYNKKIGERINSSVIKATATDCISDAVATFVVLISSVLGGLLQIPLDGYVGACVSLFIIFAGARSAKETIDPLLGVAPDPELLNEIYSFINSYDVVCGIHDLIVHNYGVGRELISLHAEVPCDEDILYIHEKIDEIEVAIWEKFHMQAVIHMDPVEVNNSVVSETKEKVRIAIFEVYENVSMHDFRMVSGENKTNLIFDVVVPHDEKDSEEAIKEKISSAVLRIDKRYRCVIKIDRPFI